MQLKSLKVFCDVVGRRSFSRAADENGISQSGASQMVHQLEDHLGVRLIDRSKRPFVLTPEGQVYYDGCREIVHKFFTLEEEVRTLHEDVSGRVAVAAIYSVGLSRLNGHVQNFLSQNPTAKLRLEYQHPERVYELVENDRVDIGLISYPKSTRTIAATPWHDEPMVLVFAPSHPLAGRQYVALQDLQGLDVIGFDPDLKIRREIDRALSQHGVDVNVVMEFDNIETIKRAIEINAGVSLLPAPTVDREVQAGSLATCPLDGIKLIRPLGIIQRRGVELCKTARRFVQLLLDSAEKHQSPNTDSQDGRSAEARTPDDSKRIAS